MEVLGLPPCSQIGEIKETIKDAILDGKIPNEHDAAYQLMLEKAASMNLYPISKDTDN